MGQQLFQCETALAGMLAGGEFGEIRAGRRLVQIGQGLIESRQAEICQQLIRQPVFYLPQPAIQCLLHEPAQARLLQALRCRVDGRQPVFQCRGLASRESRYSGWIISGPAGPGRTVP